MICVVKCEYGKIIQLPCGVSEGRGSSLKCPHDCPNRRMCSTVESFKVIETLTDDGRIGRYGDMIRYSAGEANSIWGRGKALQTYPDLSVDDSADEGVEGDESIFEELKSKSVYNMFTVRRNVFSNDPTIRRNVPMSRPLGSAMKEIFQYWDTAAVFESDGKLKDDFIWLMVTGAKGTPIYKSEVDHILNNKSYNRSQKFFHIFYDVVYKDNRPDGFYWSDNDVAYQPIMPRFKDKDEFVSYLFKDGGAGFKFYKSRKDEVLSFLGVDSEEEFFTEITAEYAENMGEIIWVDSTGAGNIRNFGKKEMFISMMHHPSSPDLMQDMVEFLKRYTISSKGVAARPSDIPFEIIDPSKCTDDKQVRTAASVPGDMSVSAYATYLSLLREYVKSFSPRDIKVGQLSFTSANYAQETEDYIVDYCKEKMIYSNGGESMDAKRKRGNALLAANLYELGVLSSFARGNEEGVKESIKLLSKVSGVGQNVDMKWYVSKLRSDHPNDFEAVIQNDRLVALWLDDSVEKSVASAIESLFNKYENLYHGFRKNG